MVKPINLRPDEQGYSNMNGIERVANNVIDTLRAPFVAKKNKKSKPEADSGESVSTGDSMATKKITPVIAPTTVTEPEDSWPEGWSLPVYPYKDEEVIAPSPNKMNEVDRVSTMIFGKPANEVGDYYTSNISGKGSGKKPNNAWIGWVILAVVVGAGGFYAYKKFHKKDA